MAESESYCIREKEGGERGTPREAVNGAYAPAPETADKDLLHGNEYMRLCLS